MRNAEHWKWGGFAVFLLGFLWLYFYLGTHLVYQTNRDRLNWDQQHNINLAFRTAERAEQGIQPGESITAVMWRAFPHYTDGVVNPLWPWFAAKFRDTDHERFFEKGKWVNLTLSACFLVVLGIISARAFSFLSAPLIVLACGLGAFLPRAVYFQPEPIFYIFFFLAWMCALSLLRKNDVWLYGVLGFLFALAYLAKGSWQPFALVFVGVTLLRSLAAWIRGIWLKKEDTRWNLANQFIGLAALITVFAVTAWPRLSYSNATFGDPMHSYPGYWMWMDDFNDGAQFMIRYSTKEALTSMDPETKPSLSNYLKTHSRDEFFQRLREGTIKKSKEFFFPPEVKQNRAKTKEWRQILPQRGWILIWLFITLIVISVFHFLAWRNRDQLVWPVGTQSAWWMLLFSVGVFTVSSLAFGFFEPIGKGDRFMLGLYSPMIVTFIWIVERFRRQLQRTRMASIVNLVFAICMAIPLAVIAFRVVQLLDTPLFWAAKR
ncbi:MAG: hypothetical protein HKN23_17940 [Verrucomicrobiales bacterium]|nr:hypothetical protein [Verrucomicrobiales bacterium]